MIEDNITPEQDLALKTARSMLDLGHSLESILSSGLIPSELCDFIQEEIQQEENIILEPAGVISADQDRVDWLRDIDRSQWYYWSTLRQYLLTKKGWDSSVIRSLDDNSDSILRQLHPPSDERFDIRGLVLGFVQSGKTANYTALIAKAADTGYRLIVVLSGIDNGLRLQTNSRLKRELVGYSDGRPGAVRMPPWGKQWHEFTLDELGGDFDPGFANHAALQGPQPVLLVVKKNGHVLRRLLRWLNEAPLEVRRTLPTLVIDDEADQASVDTRGSYQSEADPLDSDYEPPTPINGLIRELLSQFERSAYIAYTATPFANILIPHDTSDPTVGNDLYPKDFIINLPKPSGYIGAEELFGRMDDLGEDDITGMDIVRHITDEDILRLDSGQIPESLEAAILAFVLAGAGRAQRKQDSEPVTMLIHTSRLNDVQAELRHMVETRFFELRDEWRYQRDHGIRDQLRHQWDTDFRIVTESHAIEKDVQFETIEPYIGPFLEAVQIREVNSAAGEVLDYESEPALKAIAIGGNKLSRGLTLEGLVVSYFLRRTVMYDTLMQMGRWFGFRNGYEDLTRIYTTPELQSWFSDLAFVDHRLREDIEVYENQGVTPYELGMRIWQHPSMQVTSPLKRRFASSTMISQSYSLAIEQTFKFPFHRLDELAVQADRNLSAVRELIGDLGTPDKPDESCRPVWSDIRPERILSFLNAFHVDSESSSISIPLITAYIERLVGLDELTSWAVAICARKNNDHMLGSVDWGFDNGPLSQISRSRLGDTNSVGVITSDGDELLGLPDDLITRAESLIEEANALGRTKSVNRAAREVRPATNGLLLLYPISRNSGHDIAPGKNRRALFENPLPPQARDLIGMAISFPQSQQRQTVEAFVEGTVGWSPVE